MSKPYTIENLRNMVNGLTAIFDLVQIVDPLSRKILLLDSEDNINYEEYPCYQVWNKQESCENCICLRTWELQRRLIKYEFVDDDVYQVVAKHIEILDQEGQIHRAAIEIISKITDEIMLGTNGKGEVFHRLVEAERKVYTDSLTKVYNRRYYDERSFCHQSKIGSSNRVVFILADLKQFKSINDNYGHDVGDWVLTTVGQTMLQCVREYDSVIRLGGDEFLIILNNCSKEVASRVINDIKERLRQNAVYDEINHKYAQGNFGVAYTEDFDNTEECIANLLKQADFSMYEDKNMNE